MGSDSVRVCSVCVCSLSVETHQNSLGERPAEMSIACCCERCWVYCNVDTEEVHCRIIFGIRFDVACSTTSANNCSLYRFHMTPTLT